MYLTIYRIHVLANVDRFYAECANKDLLLDAVSCDTDAQL